MWDHCKNLLRFTAPTDHFNLVCLKHETKGQDFTDVHSIGKAVAHFPVYFMQVSVHTLRTWEFKKLLASCRLQKMSVGAIWDVQKKLKSGKGALENGVQVLLKACLLWYPCQLVYSYEQSSSFIVWRYFIYECL